MEKVKPLELIQYEGRVEKITALISVANLDSDQAVLNPQYLDYDIFYSVSLRADCEIPEIKRTDFISEYKALCGHVLSNKYQYSDYINGGLSLLTRDKFLNSIYEAQTLSEIVKILYDEYELVHVTEKETKRMVGKRKYVAVIISLISISILLAFSLGYIAYDLIHQTKNDKAYIAGYEAYFEKNYSLCINEMLSVDINNLDKVAKQILAIAYVKTDNLTQDQKDNITSDITNSDTEVLYDYWVKLGRGMYEESQNVAKQLSDDELLLYAYMKEAVFLKNDTEIEGETKAQRLELIENQIDKLSKKYETEDEP